jgi:hypothetical protein
MVKANYLFGEALHDVLRSHFLIRVPAVSAGVLWRYVRQHIQAAVTLTCRRQAMARNERITRRVAP